MYCEALNCDMQSNIRYKESYVPRTSQCFSFCLAKLSIPGVSTSLPLKYCCSLFLTQHLLITLTICPFLCSALILMKFFASQEIGATPFWCCTNDRTFHFQLYFVFAIFCFCFSALSSLAISYVFTSSRFPPAKHTCSDANMKRNDVWRAAGVHFIDAVSFCIPQHYHFFYLYWIHHFWTFLDLESAFLIYFKTNWSAFSIIS